uniref:RRM domain-containing protein n=1 Tax=Heterorhabditis bacteriophora TaxID=37862 RepID=A0A1I7XP64_HETBA
MVAVSSPSNKSTVMGRESRHVYVSGLPETVTDEKINGFFSIYGRVHQIERSADGVVVSFMDVRSAQKAHAGDHRLEPGIPFRITFHEPGTKNGLMTSSSISTGGSNGTVSPKSIEVPRRRTPSPRGNKDSNRHIFKLKNILHDCQLRVSSSAALKRIIRSDPHRREQGRSPENSSSTAVACSSGLQGVYVERLPPRSDGTVKESIRDALKKHGRIVDISIEGDGDARKALVIFQSNCKFSTAVRVLFCASIVFAVPLIGFNEERHVGNDAVRHGLAIFDLLSRPTSVAKDQANHTRVVLMKNQRSL